MFYMEKRFINKFTFCHDVLPENILIIIDEYSDYILQLSQGKALLTDSPENADTVFILHINSGNCICMINSSKNNNSIERYQVTSEECNGKALIKISADSQAGIKWGIVELFRRTGYDCERTWIEWPLNISANPCFSKRGIHLNGWVFNHPYSFRTWSIADWEKYIDILFFLRINLLMIWPFIETIPLPLSTEDENYLMDFRQIIDYARNKRGMEVWVFMSANRVCISNDGISDPRLRPYWYPHLQVDMNPGEPDEYRMIYESRKILHKYLNNADGYCIIDSDPGHWFGSPTEEFIKIGEDNRRLIDEFNIYGKDAKLIFWMWQSWGKDDIDTNLINMLNMIKETIHEPWILMLSQNNISKLIKNNNELQRKTIFIPYGTIEGEPSIPFTNNSMEKLNPVFKLLDDYPDICGIMGNTQTPMVQFPNIFYFAEKAWNYPECCDSEEDMIAALSVLILPEYAKTLAVAWTMLKNLDPEEHNYLWNHSPNSMLKSWKAPDVKNVNDLILNLEEILKNAGGRLGLIGSKIVPSPESIIEDLILQLKVACSAEEAYLCVHTDTPRELWLKKIEIYFSYVAEWALRTGYGKGILPPRHWKRFIALLKENIHISRRYLEWEELIPMQRRLRTKYGNRIADHLVCTLYIDLIVDEFNIKMGSVN